MLLRLETSWRMVKRAKNRNQGRIAGTQYVPNEAMKSDPKYIPTEFLCFQANGLLGAYAFSQPSNVNRWKSTLGEFTLDKSPLSSPGASMRQAVSMTLIWRNYGKAMMGCGTRRRKF